VNNWDLDFFLCKQKKNAEMLAQFRKIPYLCIKDAKTDIRITFAA